MAAGLIDHPLVAAGPRVDRSKIGAGLDNVGVAFGKKDQGRSPDGFISIKNQPGPSGNPKTGIGGDTYTIFCADFRRHSDARRGAIEHHALAGRWQDEIAAEPFIAMSHGSSVRQLTDLAMAQAGVSPTTLVEARNTATAGGIIAAGLGVSAFPELVLPLMSSTNIATRRLTGPTMYREIAVITPADTVLAPPAQRFVERLRASFS